MEQIDARGQACPLPVVRAKKALSAMGEGVLEVLVDNETAVHNLEALAKTLKVGAVGEERGEGVSTGEGEGVWLDTPMIDQIHGEGTLEKRLPGMLRMYSKYDIDIRKVPIVVYPTLHYQNGGLKITPDGMTAVSGLFVAGEAVGGIHGRNRLMGNSLLDVIVFGRNAGQHAAAHAKTVKLGAPTLQHVEKFAKELADAGIDTHTASPQLLPDYRNHKK